MFTIKERKQAQLRKINQAVSAMSELEPTSLLSSTNVMPICGSRCTLQTQNSNTSRFLQTSS